MDAENTATTTAGAAAPPAVCFRHPERESYVRCTRCDRYSCPDCRREAAVGYQCVECVREGNKGLRQATSVFGGRIPRGGVPVVTVGLIVLNVLAYLLELAKPDVVDRFANLGQAVIGPDGGHYLVHSSWLPTGYHAVGVAHGEWYRLITSAFLHLPPTGGVFGITHILFNMYWLWVLGRVVEERLGAVRYLALYLLSALGGSVLGYLLADPGQPSLGASGAIFGLAGGYFVLSRRLHHDPLGGGQLLATFVVWMVVSAGFTSWEGHLGGLLAGLAVGAAYAFAPRSRQALVQAAGAVAVLGVLVVLTLLKTADLAANTPWSA
ncbi:MULTISPECIES: rhomboid family intramembrane serine protease [Kitasatospora]|uniref:Membrane associated rhomboid family serine protease n=2 Tax=Kitasatospora TaxID=2063 RepID=A0ABT1IUI4_9ACTN|nr:rhomboid family intramembrane serine protease [Kitasatospora paracochleata]MCP2308796.1 membrane associated rhomboid family serine protease [Kitasatospora paracochleata]